MKEKDHYAMCIGGPHAGRRVVVRKDMFFDVPVLIEPREPGELPTVTQCRYHLQFFGDNEAGVRVACWAPDNQSPLDTVRKLLGTYEQWHRGCDG